MADYKFRLPGNAHLSPADMFAAMSEWCRDNNVEHDVYGEGELIQSFENKIASLLGYEAGLFVITGTLAQCTALQLACESRGKFNVAMHQSSHVYLREAQGFQAQNRFNIFPVGQPYRPWQLADLEQVQDPLGAMLYELPMREIGGQAPSLAQLKQITDYCHQQHIHTHLDGARLWETLSYYQQQDGELTYADITQGFDSTYVSLYKGINGFGGAMLLGDAAFIRRAQVWMKRQGGNVFRRSPYIIAAAMQFDQRIAQMPQLFARTKQLYQQVSHCSNMALNPSKPQASMCHVHFPLSIEEMTQLRDKLAESDQIWIGCPQAGMLPNQCFIEWYIGDNLLKINEKQLQQILAHIDNEIAAIIASR
ncbi:threonine aldolase family protein [Shewanella intestini]|uniref:Threonine aldolase n=1 Tax=Shewanella intestini TaxID=2017544 RepID=A0ABS5I118_9GAMM|nr:MULTISPECIES: beta-eliminating lyase-related protein [Shewanella]MBR9727718.1 threonine aldolase [Shewanella intestini]MRG35132.1 threonine aldolase [Shewanella sp. XMDDZSB0408]